MVQGGLLKARQRSDLLRTYTDQRCVLHFGCHVDRAATERMRSRHKQLKDPHLLLDADTGDENEAALRSANSPRTRTWPSIRPESGGALSRGACWTSSQRARARLALSLAACGNKLQSTESFTTISST